MAELKTHELRINKGRPRKISENIAANTDNASRFVIQDISAIMII